MSVRVTMVGHNWVEDKNFISYFAEELTREIEDNIRAGILLSDPGSDQAKIAQSVKVEYRPPSTFSVTQTNVLDEMRVTTKKTEVRPIPLSTAAGQASMGGDDPISAGAKAAMERLPSILSRVHARMAGAEAVAPATGPVSLTSLLRG